MEAKGGGSGVEPSEWSGLNGSGENNASRGYEVGEEVKIFNSQEDH